MTAPTTTTPTLDFRVEGFGSVVMFTPLTREARQFTEREMHIESWQWMGNGFAIETRLAGPLMEQIAEQGFTL